MFTAKKVYAMLENESLWETAAQCHQILAAAKIPHAVMGGVAVCLHGYQRNTVDIDLLIRKEDSQAIRECLEREGFTWNAKAKEFSAPSGVAIQFLLAGDRAGTSSEVKLPDPADERATTEIEDLPVLKLSKLIDSKIACGMGNPRRTHKDLADVIELIIHNRLNSSFARFLHKSLRTTYRELVRQSRGKA
jgi:aminoglycoside-2''-adenylyltransferase